METIDLNKKKMLPTNLGFVVRIITGNMYILDPLTWKVIIMTR